MAALFQWIGQHPGYGTLLDEACAVEFAAGPDAPVFAELALTGALKDPSLVAEADTDAPSSDSDQATEDAYAVDRDPRDPLEPCWLAPCGGRHVIVQDEARSLGTVSRANSDSSESALSAVFGQEEDWQKPAAEEEPTSPQRWQLPPAPPGQRAGGAGAGAGSPHIPLPPGLEFFWPPALGNDAAAPPGEVGSGTSPAAAAAATVTPGGPQLTCSHCTEGRTSSVVWRVDAKKLQSKDKGAVSPSFELFPEGPALTFRLMLQPRSVSQKKGGECFKKARGIGTVQLKCEAAMCEGIGSAPITFEVSVGQEPPRGPITHDFAQGGVCGLPRAQQDWNFGAAVDTSSQTFLVRLEATYGGATPQGGAPRGISG